MLGKAGQQRLDQLLRGASFQCRSNIGQISKSLGGLNVGQRQGAGMLAGVLIGWAGTGEGQPLIPRLKSHGVLAIVPHDMSGQRLADA